MNGRAVATLTPTFGVNGPLEGHTVTIYPVFVDRGLQGADEASRPEGGGAVRRRVHPAGTQVRQGTPTAVRGCPETSRRSTPRSGNNR